MQKWLIVAGLAAFNLVLGAGVYQRIAERSTLAQIGAARPDIATVAGNNNGQTVVYMLDVTSGRLIALRVDVSNKRVDAVARANVADALKRIP